MSCQACIQDPSTHSFHLIARRSSNYIFYTSFKTVKDYSNSTAILQHITGELNKVDISGGWAWIIDCRYMAAKHIVQMQVCFGIIRLLQQMYTGTLRHLYIVNGGTVMSTALTAIYPFVTKDFISRIHKLNGSSLEIFEQLKGMGWKGNEIDPVIRRIIAEQ